MSTLHHILFKEKRLTLQFNVWVWTSYIVMIFVFSMKICNKAKRKFLQMVLNNFRGRTRTNVQVGAVYVRPYEEILTRISRKSKLLRWEQENIATLWRGKTFYSVILACPKLHRLFCVTFFISSGNCYQLHKISEKCVGFKRQKICEFCQKKFNSRLRDDYWLMTRSARFYIQWRRWCPRGRWAVKGQLEGSYNFCDHLTTVVLHNGRRFARFLELIEKW